MLAEQPRELEDGYLLFSPGDTSLQRLRRVPGQAPERTVLTLAVVCGDTPFGAFTQMLQNFNLSQDAYRIDWTLYTDSQYADGEPADLLRTELIADAGRICSHFIPTVIPRPACGRRTSARIFCRCWAMN